MNLLQASGITLEPQTAEHAEEMFALLRDPAIYEFENSPPPSVAWLCNRYRQLESRRSPDGSEHWLNWIIRLSDNQVAGYVQASAKADGHCHIAYVLGSAYWGRSIARRSVEAMIAELQTQYGAHTLWAVFKEANQRSRQLLRRLEFKQAAPADYRLHGAEPGEVLMNRRIGAA